MGYNAVQLLNTSVLHTWSLADILWSIIQFLYSTAPSHVAYMYSDTPMYCDTFDLCYSDSYMWYWDNKIELPYLSELCMWERV